MEKVVTINLNGNAYQLDESAFEALRAYLGRASAALAANPDKDEIIRDLEQAIADKSAAYLNARKSVVSATEMARVLEEMGPVEGDAGAPGADESAAAPPPGERPTKKLYRVREGAMIAGVCAGIGAFFDLHPNIIRGIFIVLLVFTSFGFGFVYLVLMFVMPSAATAEEWAQARGVPFNAQGVIDDAKRRYSEFEDRGGVRGAWRTMKRDHPDWGFGGGGHWGYQPAAPAKPVGYFTRVIAGIVAIIVGIISAALTIAFLIALVSLATSGAILGWAPEFGPLWLHLVILCIVFAAISAPFAAIRRASFQALNGNEASVGNQTMDGLSTLLFVGLLIWLLYMFAPGARPFFEALPDMFAALIAHLGSIF